MCQIKFSAFSYTYPNAAQPALDRVSLQVNAGSFVLVIGESGSGKSTLLRCLNGLAPHFSGGTVAGEVRVADLNPVREGPSRMAQHVGMVFQDPEAQFVLGRVEDEVAFALENAAVPRTEIVARVDEVLQQMEIEPLRHRSIDSLSGGEQQRVAIAAALVLRPQILALDEPTSQLDPESSDDVLDALARLNRDAGLTVILAEHRIERVLSWVHHVILVEGGHVTSGEPRDVLAHTDLVPPVVALGKSLHLEPLPLDVHDAAQHIHRPPPSERHASEATLPASPSVSSSGRLENEGRLRLQVTALHARYGSREALKGVDLTVRAGEIVALMGRNGAGKSTLLKGIIGLIKPTRGDIRVDGEPVIGRDPADICRDVAYLPQNPSALLFADTVRGELEITLANHNLRDEKDVLALLRRLGLERYEQHYPRDLSVGERERVAVGAVTVTEPRLILLDEPTRGLDYGAKRALMTLLRQWQADHAGLLLVTHDVEFVAGCASRVVLLSEGLVTADGDPRQVLEASTVFAPQMVQMFPGAGWLTAEDAIQALAGEGADR